MVKSIWAATAAIALVSTTALANSNVPTTTTLPIGTVWVFVFINGPAWDMTMRFSSQAACEAYQTKFNTFTGNLAGTDTVCIEAKDFVNP
jgi:hypothetical protein